MRLLCRLARLRAAARAKPANNLTGMPYTCLGALSDFFLCVGVGVVVTAVVAQRSAAGASARIMACMLHGMQSSKPGVAGAWLLLQGLCCALHEPPPAFA